jgi:hypothetical protein
MHAEEVAAADMDGVAEVRSAPASVPSASVSRPSRRSTCRPFSSISVRSVPAKAMQSVTRNIPSGRGQRQRASPPDGHGCRRRSARRPAAPDRTAPARPGARWPIWLMALNRCVAQRAPAANAARAVVIAAIAVAKADHRARAGQRRDLLRAGRFGRQRHHQRRQAARGVAKPGQVVVGHGPDQRRVMGALAARVQMRPLKMQAKEARHARLGRAMPAAMTRAVASGVSVISVGRMPAVPSRDGWRRYGAAPPDRSRRPPSARRRHSPAGPESRAR